MPALSVLIALPILGAIVIALLPKERASFAKQTALGTASITTVWTILCLLRLDAGDAGFQLEERHAWMSALGVTFHLALDGLNLPILLAAAIFAPIAVVASLDEVKRREREFYCALLLMVGSTVGSILALDAVLFAAFCGLGVVPMSLLIGIWGGKARGQCATKHGLFAVAGLFAFAGAMALQKAATGAATFSIADLVSSALASGTATPATALFAFVVATMFAGALFPAHTWSADVASEAPRGVFVWTIGATLPVATYAFVRFVLPFVPTDCATAKTGLALLALTTLVYGGALALVQVNLRRRIAYTAMSHAGFVLFGAVSLREAGVSGALFHALAGGLALGLLAYIVTILQARRSAVDLDRFGGLGRVTPRLNLGMLVAIATLAAAPGLAGFPGYLAIFTGGFAAFGWWTLVAMGGVVIAAAGLIALHRGVMLGALSKRNAKTADLAGRELAVVALLIVALVSLGIFADRVLGPVQQTTESAVARMADENGGAR